MRISIYESILAMCQYERVITAYLFPQFVQLCRGVVSNQRMGKREEGVRHEGL